MCYNIASVVYVDFLAMRHVGSKLPNKGLNPITLALESEVLTTGLPEKSLLKKKKKIKALSCVVWTLLIVP